MADNTHFRRQLETANTVSRTFLQLLEQHSARSVAYSALGIVVSLIDRMDGPGATAKAVRRLNESGKEH